MVLALTWCLLENPLSPALMSNVLPRSLTSKKDTWLLRKLTLPFRWQSRFLDTRPVGVIIMLLVRPLAHSYRPQFHTRTVFQSTSCCPQVTVVHLQQVCSEPCTSHFFKCSQPELVWTFSRQRSTCAAHYINGQNSLWSGCYNWTEQLFDKMMQKKKKKSPLALACQERTDAFGWLRLRI